MVSTSCLVGHTRSFLLSFPLVKQALSIWRRRQHAMAISSSVYICKEFDFADSASRWIDPLFDVESTFDERQGT
jgi:hypothetical protein